jgi:hypothetical protein
LKERLISSTCWWDLRKFMMCSISASSKLFPERLSILMLSTGNLWESLSAWILPLNELVVVLEHLAKKMKMLLFLELSSWIIVAVFSEFSQQSLS